MTRVELDNIRLTDVEGLRVNYERQRWFDENDNYDPNEETHVMECLPVCDTDSYNPLPKHLK